MRSQQKKSTKTTRTTSRRTVRKKEKQPLPNVVSLRITDRELLELEGISRATSKSVSQVVREAIAFWLMMRQRVLSL